jgi:hypothetical protein
MVKLRTLFLAIGIFCALPVLGASADPPPGPYFNGFETNTAGWFNFAGATIDRVPSGDAASYASGIPAAAGNWFARLSMGTNVTCPSGAGTQDWYPGPFTNWGGYSSIFPTGGYKTRLDIYLDTAWAATHLPSDRRFDWSSAINNTTGQHRRDFVFNVGTEPTGFVISASTNGNRCGAFPADPTKQPYHVMTSGWYTFEHDFTGVPGGPLVVVMRLIHQATNTTLFTWVRSDPSDVIGVTVGGNRYGWFVQNEIEDLAIDNSERTGLVSTPGCEVKISDGGWITALNTDRGSFGGNAKVSMSGETTGEQTYHDHGPVQPLTFKAVTVQAVICEEDDGVKSAEIHGRGTVDGEGDYQYRIKLTDEGEPGTDDKYGIIIPEVAYASGDRTLGGGNVQIRGTITS